MIFKEDAQVTSRAYKRAIGNAHDITREFIVIDTYDTIETALDY